MLRASLLIARKELAQRLRDRTFFVLGVAAPLILAFVFNLILGGVVGPGSGPTFKFGLLDEGAGTAGEGFEQALSELEAEGLVTLTIFADAEAAQMAVDEGDVAAVFVLPPELDAGGPAEIRILSNVDAQIGAPVAVAIAEAFARRMWIGNVAIRAGFDLGVIAFAEIEEAIATTQAAPFPVTTETEEVRSRQVPTTTFFVAGLGLFFTFFIVGLSITSLLDERSGGTLARLVAAPIRPAAIVAGKMLASVLLGIIAMTVLVLASWLIMGAEWGNLLFTGAIIIATVFAAAGLMTFVGALARTAEQAGNLQSIVALTLAMLGGTFVPIAAGEGLLNTLRYLTPNAWYLRGLGDVVGGAYGDAMIAVAILFAIGLVFGSIGLIRVRRVVLA